MQLGADVAIDTSAKHAQAVLQRRADFIQQRIQALQENIAALRARPGLAAEAAPDLEVLAPSVPVCSSPL
jgi:prefoldin subunit 5